MVNLHVRSNVSMPNLYIMSDRGLYNYLTIGITLLSLSFYSIAKGQTNILDPELEHYIKASVIKSNFFSSVEYSKPQDSSLYSFKYYGDDGQWFKSNPGFGYLPVNLLDIKVEPVPLEYPDKSFKLYSVRITDNSYYYFQSLKWLYLIGINDKKQIKYIAGPLLKHRIAQDFRFKKNSPESYIPYLKIKYFDIDIKELKYTGKTDGNQYVYECLSNRPDVERYIIKFNPSEPERYHQEYKQNPAYKDSGIITPVFTNRQKHEYILNEVMKNIYTYRLNVIPGLLDIKDDKYYIKSHDSPFDTLLPDYDEILELGIRMEETINCTYQPGSQGAKLNGNDRESCYLEIFSIFKFSEALIESPYIVKTDKQTQSKELEIIKDDEFKELSFYYEHADGIESYLVAYDTATRDVFYISGNFYLSKILDLYHSDWVANLQANGVGWNRSKDGNYGKFSHYLKHRLFAYDIRRETMTIIKDDEKELLIDAIRKYRGKDIPVTIRIDYDFPEVVSIKERK